MKFKSVCKHWRTLIQKDWRFIDLHFMRSQSHRVSVGATSLLISPPLMHTYGEHCFLLAELLTLLGGGDKGGATVHTKIPDVRYRSGVTFLEPVNGLFCFINIRTYCVCIHNPSTRESTSWIKLAIKREEGDEGELIDVIDEHGDLVEYCVSYIYLSWKFGYDPTTKEHKVIWIWVRQLSNGPEKKEVCLCEVLTVRHNSWRIIDAVPPVSPSCLSAATSAYANGYWLLHGSDDDEFDPYDVDPLIVEFSVGTEKFRVISIPNFIVDDLRPPYNSGNGLTEVDGRLVLLARKMSHTDYDFNSWIKNKSISMKTCILNNNHDRDKGRTNLMSASSGSSTSNDYWWMEDSFLMPQFDWKPQDPNCVVPIPGTDLFIVRSSDARSFYYYNWRQKSYSDKFGFNGFNSFIEEKASYGSFRFQCFTFEGNIFLVI